MGLSKDTLLENRYRIDQLLAQGGMGAVYQGFDTNLDIPVAIKENFFQTPEGIRQFEQEARILARLHHPNLPRVIHHFSHNGKQYLVMDFIDGQDLWEIVKKRGKPFEEQQGIDYIMQICKAVSYLHEQEPPIIHRDVKPQNIKITGKGRAVLVDFGIAKVAEADVRTSTGARGVTPGYSPPEQYSSHGTTPASDIYALGATLYAVLTGKKPPDSVSLMTDAVKFEAPKVLNPKLSRQVNQAITYAMQAKQTKRPQSVKDWQQELVAMTITKTPQSAKPNREKHTSQKEKSPINKNQIWLLIGALVIMCVCVMVGGGAAYFMFGGQAEETSPAIAEAAATPLPEEVTLVEDTPTSPPEEEAAPTEDTPTPPPSTTSEATVLPASTPAEAAQQITAPTGNSTQTITYGQMAEGAIPQMGDQHTYIFTGQEGEFVTAFLYGDKFNFQIIGPDDKGLDCDTSYASRGYCQLNNVKLHTTGEYSLVVDGQADYLGDYTLHLTKVDDTTRPIDYGQIMEGTIVLIGDQHSYTFTGQEGEFVTAFLYGDKFNFQIIGPDDKGLDCDTSYASRGYCQLNNVKLHTTGEYSLVVDGQADYLGDYTLHLTKVDDTTRPIDYGQIMEGTIVLIGDQHSYTFTGQEGEFVTAFLYGDKFNFQIIGPDDKGLDCDTSYASRGYCQLNNVKLHTTGEYSLVVDGQADYLGDYTLHLTKVNDTLRPIDYGQTVEGTINQIGDQHSYTFQAQKGERVTTRLEGTKFNFYLVGPDDKGWDCDTSYASRGNCQLDNIELSLSGEYTLIVDGQADYLGDYSLTLVKN